MLVIQKVLYELKCHGYCLAGNKELLTIFFCLQVVAEFQACGANYTNLSDNEIRALFDKKVNSNPKFKVRKDIVRLVK